MCIQKRIRVQGTHEGVLLLSALQQPLQLPKKPLATIPRVGATSLGTYEELSRELEFFPAQLLEEQINCFLVDQGIPVYDYKEVDRYLTNIARQQKKVWIWRPLRERDKRKAGVGQVTMT